MRERPSPLLRSVLILIETMLLFILLAGCRTHRQVTAQPPPVVLENVTEVQDTIKESHTEVDREREKTTEQTKESTTEKIIIVVNTEGDTIRTDREKTTVIDHLLKVENERLKAQVDSLMTATQTKEKIEVPVYINVPVEVEREFTAWEKFRLKAFWWLLGGFAVSAGYIFRKPILTLAKRIIK